MASTASISISLPEDVLAQARSAANERNGSLDELVSIAIQRYVRNRDHMLETMARGHAWGKAAGITSDEDVQRIADGQITLADLQPPA